MSTVSVSIDGVATPFHAVTELFFTELPTFPAETLATLAHIHLWQKPRAEQVLTLFSPSVESYAIVSPFSVQARANATGELLNRRGDSWQTAAGAIGGRVSNVLGNCETLQPPRDEIGFGCRQAVFSLAIDATLSATTVASTVRPVSRRLVMATSDVEGVLLPAVGILPSPASRF
ncbi:MAG: hypothetical protein H7Z74_04460 [Anaerolineae bacterium]|nr:hypothetical protein [Gemmatimonadaceae bacterium]